ACHLDEYSNSFARASKGSGALRGRPWRCRRKFRLATLKGTHVKHDCPAISWLYLLGVRWHVSDAVADHIEKLTCRLLLHGFLGNVRRLDPRPLLQCKRASVHHSIPIPGQAVARSAIDPEA